MVISSSSLYVEGIEASKLAVFAVFPFYGFTQADGCLVCYFNIRRKFFDIYIHTFTHTYECLHVFLRAEINELGILGYFDFHGYFDYHGLPTFFTVTWEIQNNPDNSDVTAVIREVKGQIPTNAPRMITLPDIMYTYIHTRFRTCNKNTVFDSLYVPLMYPTNIRYLRGNCFIQFCLLGIYNGNSLPTCMQHIG
jgi:hypothetical protein